MTKLMPVVKLSFSNKNIKYKWGDSPLFKISEELNDYVSPQKPHPPISEEIPYDLQIPSITGGRLIMAEYSDGENFQNPKVDFYYIIKFEERELREDVIKIINKHGLEQIIKK